MRALLFIVLLFIAVAPEASAQDLFLKPKKEKSIDEQLGITKPQTGDPDQKTYSPADLANRYYMSCKKQTHEMIPPKAMDSLCMCTASGMAGSMSSEEILALFEDSNAAQAIRNKMLRNIYGPCMKYPVHDLLINQCLNNPEIKKRMRKSREVCGCMSETMTAYVGKLSPQIIDRYITINPGKSDPLGDYLASDEFERVSSGYLVRCYQIHELNLGIKQK